MHSGLSGLPVEVLTEICNNLCYHCSERGQCSRPLNLWDHRDVLEAEEESLQTLNSLSRTCTLLCSVAQPILYHHFSPFYWDWRKRYRPAITPFLRTLHETPSLAKCVVELDIRYLIAAETHEGVLVPLLESLADTFHISLPKDWPNVPKNAIGNLIMSFFFCLAPNIETACIGLIPGWTFSNVSETAKSGRSTMLQSLKTLSLVGPPTPRSCTAYQGVNDLLSSAPNLQSLRLDALTYTPPAHLVSNLRRLEIKNGEISHAALREMLKSCTQLQEFHYTRIFHDQSGSELRGLGSEIVEALEPSKNALRCLKIRYANQTPCLKNTNFNIASLKHFSKLEHLDLSMGLPSEQKIWSIPGTQAFVDMLPDSIRSFCPPCWPDDLLGLAEAVGQGRFEDLKKLELEHGLDPKGGILHSGSWTRKKHKLRTAMKVIGVDVTCIGEWVDEQWHVA